MNTNLSKTNTIIAIPIRSYSNVDIQKKEICQENMNKTGIYRWINIVSGKSYVGSAINLSQRLRNYFNRSYLIKEGKKNNSLIYKALLKYGYSNFKLDILEYCNVEHLIKREQFYLDTLKLEYNTLKFARSLTGFKHSVSSKERISIAKLGKPCSEVTKLKLSANSQAFALNVKNVETQEICSFSSIRKTADFLNMHHSYLAKCLIKNKFYKGKGYYVTKKLV